MRLHRCYTFHVIIPRKFANQLYNMLWAGEWKVLVAIEPIHDTASTLPLILAVASRWPNRAQKPGKQNNVFKIKIYRCNLQSLRQIFEHLSPVWSEHCPRLARIGYDSSYWSHSPLRYDYTRLGGSEYRSIGWTNLRSRKNKPQNLPNRRHGA